MIKWVNEIATSYNQRTVGLLTMTILYRHFHPHIVPQCGMNVCSKKLAKVGLELEKNPVTSKYFSASIYV
ncbi:MAG: hypothetical protein ACOX6A_09860 [Atribacter sp.]|jgi:hypothetical protein|uniref:hypothetical protein n=1 Tax=Atribacter sp. TaxID=2847780 RepID=UPI003D990234